MPNWSRAFESFGAITPGDLNEYVLAASAAARRAMEETQARERGLTGAVAAVMRWPADLREAVGPGTKAQQKAATTVGIFGQIVVTVVGGSIASLIVALAVQVWRAVAG